MATVNMHEAKTRLSQLVAAVENGSEAEVVIARNGKPAARIVPIGAVAPKGKRLGIAEGRWNFDYDAFQALDAEVARSILESPLFPPEVPAQPSSTRVKQRPRRLK
jgi:prevent-host-death family protein